MRLIDADAAKNEQYLLLLDDLDRTQHDLQSAYSNLAYMTDPDLIDYYIYQVKAAQMRHKFLLSKVKQIQGVQDIPLPEPFENECSV